MNNDSYRSGHNKGPFSGGDWDAFQQGRNDRARWDDEMARRQGGGSGVPMGGGGGGGGGALIVLVLAVALLLVIVPSAVLAVPGALVLMLLTPLMAGSLQRLPPFGRSYSTAFYAFLAYGLIHMALQSGLFWLTLNHLQLPGLLRDAAMASSVPHMLLNDLYQQAMGRTAHMALDAVLQAPGVRDPRAIGLALLVTQVPALLVMVLILGRRIGPPYWGWLGGLRALATAVAMLLVSVSLAAVLAVWLIPQAQPLLPDRRLPLDCLGPAAATSLVIWLLVSAALLAFALRLLPRAMPGGLRLSGGYGTCLLGLLLHAALLLGAIYAFRGGDAFLHWLWSLHGNGWRPPGMEALRGWLPWHAVAAVATASVVSVRLGGPYGGFAGWLLSLVWAGGLSMLMALMGLWATLAIMPSLCRL